MPETDSTIKLHAVIFKHTQKLIIEREADYRAKRIACLKAKDEDGYKKLVRRSNKEYTAIENHV